jgi:DNA-binding PadR family transcriptional regulator
MSLRFGILGLLAEQPLHGYEVKQRFEDMFGGVWDLNIGSVYQSLQRLERDGLVQPVGDRGDRGRQSYRATAAGISALQEWLEDPSWQPQLLRDELYVKMLLLARDGNGKLARLLQRQRHLYLQHLRDLAEQQKEARAKGRAQLALVYLAGRLHIEADLKWLDACVEEVGRN